MEANHLRLYPDIVEAGGLPALINSLLGDQPHQLDDRGIAVAEERSVNLTVALKKRMFLVDCWFQGVNYGSGWALHPEDAARAVSDFLGASVSVGEMETRHPWFEPRLWALHQSGPADYVEAQWTWLLQGLRDDIRGVEGLLPLAEAAAGRGELRQLMPFTSMYRLCFSRCTGYPFSNDCPSAWPSEQGGFMVAGSKLGNGADNLVKDAETAAGQLVRLLPPGVGPATHGTADTLTPL